MKVYVAGRTTDTRTVLNIAEGLEDLGHEITFKWYDPEIGEIRTGELRSEDLELLEDTSLGAEISEGSGWTTVIRHIPTGEKATGEGHSKLAAHDVAVNKLRALLNNGWSADPDKARMLADREIEACSGDSVDALVLVWAPDLLGAAIETGAAIRGGKEVYIFRPGRDSVFWYREQCRVVWSKTELMEIFDDR